MSYIFPNTCIYCGQVLPDNMSVCSTCRTKLPKIQNTICQYCGNEITMCTCKVGDFAFKRNISVYRYEGVVKTLVTRMKYHSKPQLCVFMAQQMLEAINLHYADIKFDVVTHVPMFPTKVLARGYNQSKVIACHIASKLGINEQQLLYKRLGMKTQKRLSRKDRRKNVHNKFYTKYDITSKTVLLIDDIMTTGSTLSECALMLKKGGAKAVYCATFAITCKK